MAYAKKVLKRASKADKKSNNKSPASKKPKATKKRKY